MENSLGGLRKLEVGNYTTVQNKRQPLIIILNNLTLINENFPQ